MEKPVVGVFGVAVFGQVGPHVVLTLQMQTEDPCDVAVDDLEREMVLDEMEGLV